MRKILKTILIVPMAFYFAIMTLLGRRKNHQFGHNKHFEYGYSRPTYGRAEISPKSREVWEYAQRKTDNQFKGDPLRLTVLGKVFQYLEPVTTDAFDQLLKRQVVSFDRQAGTQNTKANRLWNPADVIQYLQEKHSKFTYFYIQQSDDSEAWGIEKFGLSSHRPENSKSKLIYFDSWHMSFAYPAPSAGQVYCSFSGGQNNIQHINFSDSGAVQLSNEVIRKLCDFTSDFLKGLMDEAQYDFVRSRLNAHPTESFEFQIDDMKIRYCTEVKKPQWNEPDNFYVHIEIEKQTPN